MAFKTQRYKLDYFNKGSFYRADADYRRFVTLDYNLESYVGIVGVGIIDGWTIDSTNDLEVQVLPGHGLIDGYAVESPYTVKKRSEMVSGDREVETISYPSDPQPNLSESQRAIYVSIVQEYDPSFSPTGRIENSYVKTVVPTVLSLYDNSDNYVYARRPSGATPYPKLSDYPSVTLDKPVAINYATYQDYLAALTEYNLQVEAVDNYDWHQSPDNHFTAVEFFSSLDYTVSSSVVLLGKVVTRNGTVSSIDTSMVDSLENLTSTISKEATSVIKGHKHGGDGPFDPPKIRLETDIRECVFANFDGNDKAVFDVLDSNKTSVSEGHKHTYLIDSNVDLTSALPSGDGVTLDVLGSNLAHFHKIIGGNVQIQESSPYFIADHTHELNNPYDTEWLSTSQFNVYVNDVLFATETSPNVSADTTNKQITLTNAVGFVFRTYSTTFPVPTVDGVQALDNKVFTYSKSTNSLLNFMVSMEVEFNRQYGQYYYNSETDTISESHPFIFVESDGTSISGLDDLKEQCKSGQILLSVVGDKFTFTPNAARDITVELIAAPSKGTDKVTIEILGNTEVTGVLKDENIAFINAEKFSFGIFDLARIPFISHMGRFREKFEPLPYSLISSDGTKYTVSPNYTTINTDHYHTAQLDKNGNGVTTNTLIGKDIVYYASNNNTSYLIGHTHSVTDFIVQDTGTSGLTEWQNSIGDNNTSSSTHTHEMIAPIRSNVNAVYSMAEDSNGNLYVGTSYALYVVPSETSYVFIINGVRINVIGTSLWDLLLKAKAQYEKKTGITFNVTSEIYASQIADAEDVLIEAGTSYLIYGDIVANQTRDVTIILRESETEIPNFRYTALRKETEMRDDEIFLGVKLFDSQSGQLVYPSNYDSSDALAQAIADGLVIQYNYVARYLNDVPIWSINLKDIDGKTKIVAIGANAIAINEDIINDLYQEWSTPSLPFFSGAIKKVSRDSDNALWLPSNGGIMVSRYISNWDTFGTATLPGYTPNINDIIDGEKGASYCVSADGIFKTVNGGLTWTKKFEIDEGFKQIIRDSFNEITNTYDGHYHVVQINADGNGVLDTSIGDGTPHTHTVSEWTINSTLSHSHSLLLKLYAVGINGAIYFSEDNGETWSEQGSMPSGEYSEAFVYDSKIYAGFGDALYYSKDSGESWQKIIEDKCFSFALKYDRDGFYVGAHNVIYSTDDGETFAIYHSFDGLPLPSILRDNSRQYFGYAYSSYANSFYFRDLAYTRDYVAAFVDFSKWFSENGGWESSTPYDIFVDYKMALSTKSGIDNRSSTVNFSVDIDNGVVDLSYKSDLSEKVEIYDLVINVKSTDGLQVGDMVYIQSNIPIPSAPKVDVTSETYYSDLEEYSARVSEIKSMYIFATVTGVSATAISISERADRVIELPAQIFKLSSLDSTNSINGNIYDSQLSNVGKFTHEDVEDALSYKSDYRPYGLNNVYLSNLLQLTQGVRFVYPDIDSAFKKTNFFDFRYSDDPNDPYYIGNYIDLQSTAANNQGVYDSEFNSKRAFVVNDFLIGRNTFDGILIAATDIGLFIMNIAEGMESNWFYVYAIQQPVYALAMFGDKVLAATSDGTYTSEDLTNWDIDTNASIYFPSYAMSYRWTNDTPIIIGSHTAKFYNDVSDPSNPRGVIEIIGSLYSSIQPFRGIKVENAGSKNGNYIVLEVAPNFIKTEPFDDEYIETFNGVVITMGAWWQQFQDEINTSNPNLNNTLLVGGKGLISVNVNSSNYSWYSASLPSSLSETVINGFNSLSSGKLLAHGQDDSSYILQSTNIGISWSILKEFAIISGNILDFSPTEFGHTKLSVQYPSGQTNIGLGELDHLRIGIFSNNILQEEGIVIWNEKDIEGNNIIYTYGHSIYDILQSDVSYTFAVYPHKISKSIASPSNELVFFGTDRGLYTDKGSLSSSYHISGQVSEAGTNGTVSAVDGNGNIVFVEEDAESGNVKITTTYSQPISGGQWINKTLYITDFDPVQSYKVLSNSSKNALGQTIFVIDTVYSAQWQTYIGKRISLVGEKSRVYISFSRFFKDGKFNGGKLYLFNPIDGSYAPYDISTSAATYIDLATALVPNSTHFGAVSNGLKSGSSVRLIDSSGNLELFVNFVTPIMENDLVGLQITNGINDTKYTIVSNTEDSMLIKEASAEAFESGNSFNISGFIFKSLSTFNAKKTSTDLDHYHDVVVIGNNVTGDIASFYSQDESFATINVSNTSYFDNTLLSNADLLKGAIIDFWNPSDDSIRFSTTIMSVDQDGETITVRIINQQYWDFTAFNEVKISVGWEWKIYSERYGYTENIHYITFTAINQMVTSEIARNSTFVDVMDSSGIVIGDDVIIEDERGIVISGVINQIVSSTRVEMADPINGTFYLSHNPRLKVIRDNFSNNHTHTIRNNNVETVLVSDYLPNGYSSRHSHRVLPYISAINSMVKRDIEIILAGESGIIFESVNEGNSWTELTNINHALEGGEEVTNISQLELYNDKLLVGTEKGYVFFEGESGKFAIPLIHPSI